MVEDPGLKPVRIGAAPLVQRDTDVQLRGLTVLSAYVSRVRVRQPHLLSIMPTSSSARVLRYQARRRSARYVADGRQDAPGRDAPRSTGSAAGDDPATAGADSTVPRTCAVRKHAGRAVVPLYSPEPSGDPRSTHGSLRFPVGAAFSGRQGGVAQL